MKIQCVKKISGIDQKNTARVVFCENQINRFIHTPEGDVLEIGIGARKKLNHRKVFLVARQVITVAKQNKIQNVSVALADFYFPECEDIKRSELASTIAREMMVASYEFRTYKKKPEDGWSDVETVYLTGFEDKATCAGLAQGVAMGEAQNNYRELANTPAGAMTPKILVEAARKACKGTSVTVQVFGEAEMKKRGFGAILGVGNGSDEESQFIMLEYDGGGGKKPIVLVGKGVTFDSGGLNIKPDSLEMHMDMSGGAAVIHAIVLAARLGLKKKIVSLIPAVENMPSGKSYRPGDILTSLSGKTIEIVNTDAEGRVIMADALAYAKQYDPRLIVDVATLTGASLSALGQHVNAIMTNSQALEDKFRDWGEESGDYVWPFPLWDEFNWYIKSTYADIANGPTEGNWRHAGIIGAGKFLAEFVENTPWVHIDMAPRMTSVRGDFLTKGATGSPLPLLMKMLEKY